MFGGDILFWDQILILRPNSNLWTKLCNIQQNSTQSEMICFCTDPVLCDGILGLLRQGQGEGQGEAPNSKKLCFFNRCFECCALHHVFEEFALESVSQSPVGKLVSQPPWRLQIQIQNTNTLQILRYITNENTNTITVCLDVQITLE